MEYSKEFSHTILHNFVYIKLNFRMYLKILTLKKIKSVKKYLRQILLLLMPVKDLSQMKRKKKRKY